MKKKIVSCIVLLLTVLTVYAQTTMKVQAPELVSIDEQFNVTFVISGKGDPSSFEWEPGGDFQLVWGPQRGKMSSTSIVNGKRSSTVQSTYTYVLRPRSAGRFELPSATAKVKGETLKSGSHTIEVVAGSASSSASGAQSSAKSQSESSSDQASRSGSIDDSDIFMRMIMSKTNVVLGESVNATLKLYQRVGIAGFDDARFPSFTGFWSQPVSTPSNIEFHRENLNGEIYNVAILRSWTLIPQQVGTLRIEPSELVCLVNVRSPRSQVGSIFDSFFQDEYHTVRKRVTTPAADVHVSRLPAGAPDSFHGGVGDFKMSVSLSRDSLRTHDAASLKVTISGNGNVALLEAPQPVFPHDFEIYDTKTSDSQGSKSFEFPFIPRSSGDFVIPAVEYTYYNVKSRSYVTLSSQPMHISVARSEADDIQSQSAASSSAVVNNRKDVKNLANDIRFISTSLPSFSREGKLFAGSVLFWILYVLICAGAVLAYFLVRAGKRRRSDVVGRRTRGASRVAVKRLAAAKSYMSRNLTAAFYEELHRALLGYAADRFNIDSTELSHDGIRARLTESSVPQEYIDKYVELLDACEYARYAAAAVSTDSASLQDRYQSALSLITSIDSCMRKNTSSGKAALILLLFLALPSSVFAAPSVDSLWYAGSAAYSEGRWADAVDAWASIESESLESSTLFYNIGNAYFKQSDLAHAILYYERALKLDPSYDDARYNLEYASSLTRDRIESVPELLFVKWWHSVRNSLSPGSWAVMCLVFLLCALSAVLCVLLSASRTARRVSFSLAIVSFVVMLLCMVFSLQQRRNLLRVDKAVIVSTVAPVKSSPGNGSSSDLFVLHEGSRVKIVEKVGEWYNIRLSDGRRGWLGASELELY